MAKANTKKATPTVNHPTTPEEKKKALDTAMEQIIKNYGQGAVMFLGGEGNKKLDVESVPTGSIGLDYALGIGGLPKGRIIEIYGPESGGKTTVTLHAIAETQKLGGMAAFIDVEHALDPVYAKSLGVDIDHLIVSQPDTGEQALEIMETLARSGAIDIVVLDSVAAMVTKAEIDGEIGDSFVGVQARLMSAAMRKLTSVISKSNTVAIFINQVREKIGVMYGNPETTPGGRALKFYASVRIEVRKGEKIVDGGEIIGYTTKCKVVKNKVAPPFKETQFDMIFGEGISRLGEIITMGEELGFIKKSGAWYSYNGERLGQGKEKTKKFLKENDDLRLEIEGKIKENMSKLDMSASEDGEGTDNADTSESAAENELKEIGDEAAKADAPAPAPTPKKKGAAKKSVVVEADSDFEEFSPEDLG
ncbi:MAG: recombinase RecA [Ruminiclostridium sp.]|nr:recombinase RecA [Ruminiclostridium sp.]MBE5717176.1 recombinase RecA [Ruminiclostridium sp.]